MLRKTSTLAAAAITALAVMLPAAPAQAATTCTAFNTITLGKYYVSNNLWGQSSGSGSQCVSDTGSGATHVRATQRRVARGEEVRNRAAA